MRRYRDIAAIVTLGAAACTAPAPEPAPVPAPAPAPAPERGAFVVRLGQDTFSVERYTRTATTIEGDLVVRSPNTRQTHYRAALAPDGSVSRLELTVRQLANASARPTTQVMTFSGDTVTTVTSIGDSARPPVRARVPGATLAVPYLANSFAMYEQWVRRLQTLGRDSVRFETVSPGQTRPGQTSVSKRDAETYAIEYFGSPALARVDGRGRLLTYDGRQTTSKRVVERVDDLDIDRLAQAFAARDAAGRSFGVASPRDTARGSAGAARLTIDYGRPSLRGRTLLGGELLPWNTVWRLGANEATQLETDADLVIRGVPVPRGKYTLWMLPARERTVLIINKQTGQWGTEYRPEQDLARVPVDIETIATPVEAFTIAVEPAGQGGVIRMRWGTTQFSVPFTVGPRRASPRR